MSCKCCTTEESQGLPFETEGRNCDAQPEVSGFEL